MAGSGGIAETLEALVDRLADRVGERLARALPAAAPQPDADKPALGDIQSLGARRGIPFAEWALTAQEVGAILGYAGTTVLEAVACKPGFPVRLTVRPATWRAGDVLEWRDANRAGARRKRQ